MVDKLYIMLPEFNIIKYDKRKARQDYAKINAIFNQALSQFTNSQLAEEILNADTDDFNEWFSENKERYKLSRPIVRKINYDHSKSPQENSLKARNNLLIDMMYGVLTNADTTSKILNPGGFDYQKRAARIAAILNSSTKEELKKSLQELGIQFNKAVQENGEKSLSSKSVVSYLFDLDLDTLDKLAEKAKIKMDPLSPTTQVVLHQQNMTGGKLIGIYANHNANHALMQHTKDDNDPNSGLGLDTDNGSFVLNGKRFTSLCDIMNKDKEFISKNNAGFLAASVDMVKDNALSDINQNTFTADATMLLSRLGYNPIEIGMLMTQPIVIDITKAYFKESREGKSKDDIIDDVLKEYKYKAFLNIKLTYDNYKNSMFYIEDLANNILTSKEVTDEKSQISDDKKIEYYRNQVDVGYLFKRIMTSADALGQLVQATRADTQNGAAGPTIADTILKIQKVNDFLENVVDNKKSPLKNAHVIFTDILENVNVENLDEVRKKLLNSPLPFLQAFYTLGVEKTADMLSLYFPQFTEPFMDVIDTLRSMTKTGKLNVETMNSIYNDLLAYIVSKTQFFGQEVISELDNKILSSADKRRAFINNFPEHFEKVVTENKDIAELEFIKRLKVIRANDKNPVPTLIFKNVGQLSSTLRENYMRDWTSLLYMSNPEAQKLALNLFRYSFYRNGFAFGPNTFIHLAPVAVRKLVPEYISTLRSLITSKDDYSPFIDQYIYNHLDNRKLVPEIPDDSSVKFIDENGKIKDEVKFVIDYAATSGDKKIIRGVTNFSDGSEYDYFKYIGKRVKNDWIYYKLDSSITKDDNTAIYKRIEPLGFRNSFIEYEYGKDVEEMQSVIKKDKVNYSPNVDTSSRFDNGSTGTEEDYYSTSNISDNSSPRIDEIAFKHVYGTSLNTTIQNDNDITSIQPNTEYRDENNEKICGAETIAVF